MFEVKAGLIFGSRMSYNAIIKDSIWDVVINHAAVYLSIAKLLNCLKIVGRKQLVDPVKDRVSVWSIEIVFERCQFPGMRVSLRLVHLVKILFLNKEK